MLLQVTSEVIEALERAARHAHPSEACGILFGRANRISGYRATANVNPSPETHFEIDPQALIDAHRAARDGGLEVIGYFHSHPIGPARPSTTDTAMAAGDGRVWAIAGEGELAFWRDDPQGFAALSYTVTGR